MKKKLIALLMAGSMIMAMTGCGNEEANKEEGSKQSEVKQEVSTDDGEGEVVEETGITFPLAEPIEVDVFVAKMSEGDFIDMYSMQWMEEKTNVKLNIIQATYEELNEKKNVLINSGDYPDVFLAAQMGDGYDLGEEGILIDMTDLLKEYAPNYCAMLDEEKGWKDTQALDGKIYTLVEPLAGGLIDSAMFMNEAWLDNLGLEVPTSYEELYNVLKAFKEQDADGDGDPNNELPFLISCQGYRDFGHPLSYWGVNCGAWWEYWELSPEDEWRWYPGTEEYKDYLAFWAKCYEEGLINADCFTLSDPAAVAQTGTPVGAFFDWVLTSTVGAYEEGVNETALEYVTVLPFEGAKFTSAERFERGVFAITDKCEYPEIMTAWVDLLYSYEGSMIANYGYEGEHYEIVDGRIKVLVANDDTATLGKIKPDGVFQPAYTRSLPEKYIDPAVDPVGYGYSEAVAYAKENDLFWDARPSLTFTEDESKVNGDVMADVDPYSANYRAQVISGEIDLEETWDEYIKTMEEMGIRDVEANYAAAYERTK